MTIQLCTGLFQPSGKDLPAVEITGQIIVNSGMAYVWIDGINKTQPVLLPTHAMYNFRRMGTFEEYLTDERHLSLEDGYDHLLMLCAKNAESPTTMVRACEIMHAEGLDAEQALVTAKQWGILLCEINEADCLVFPANNRKTLH